MNTSPTSLGSIQSNQGSDSSHGAPPAVTLSESTTTLHPSDGAHATVPSSPQPGSLRLETLKPELFTMTMAQVLRNPERSGLKGANSLFLVSRTSAYQARGALHTLIATQLGRAGYLFPSEAIERLNLKPSQLLQLHEILCTEALDPSHTPEAAQDVAALLAHEAGDVQPQPGTVYIGFQAIVARHHFRTNPQWAALLNFGTNHLLP